MTSALGKPFYSFRGIPYAAPPVAELRFKAPQPPAKWTGVFNADYEPPACLQPWRNSPFPITYSEDCLYLNVFTPHLQHPSRTPMPVFVWIHGGKFYQGSGSSYKYGADFLMAKDVVVVTVNYRLGVFGYLNMNQSGAQGNAALKDKVAALRWVKKEISSFGGDPNSVTLAGGSSGAEAVGFLYISSMAKGLFSRAVSHSGAALCAWGFLPSTVSLGLRLADSLGCPSGTSQDVVSCLRATDGAKLAEQQMIFKGFEGLENPFVPTIEEDWGEEVFLSDTPQRIIANANFGGIPYIMGINSGEGLMYVDDPKTNPDQFKTFQENLTSYLPVYVIRNQSPALLQSLTSNIEDFYLGQNSSFNDTINGFVNYMSDKQFTYCIVKTVKIISPRAPVYLYYFTYEGEFKHKDRNYIKLNLSGVCHGDELGYLFYRKYNTEAHNNLTAYPQEMAIVEKMVMLWTNFGSYGNPTPVHNDLNVTWEPVKGNFTKHLIINTTLEMAFSPLLEERVAFWDSLYSSLLTKTSISEDGGLRLSSAICLLLFLIILIIVFVYLAKLAVRDYIILY